MLSATPFVRLMLWVGWPASTRRSKVWVSLAVMAKRGLRR